MVYLKSVEKVITLGKLIGLLFLFCLPLSILFLKTKMNDLARPVMGTIFLVNIYICVCRGPKSVGGNMWPIRACSKSVLSGKIRPVTPALFISTIP